MEGAESSPGVGGFDAASADLQANSGDLDILLHRLVEKLEAVPGLDTVVSYRQGRWRRLLGDLPYINDLHARSQPVSAIEVHAGAVEYLLDAGPSSVSCRIMKRSATGTVTTQPVTFSQWINELIATVGERSRAAWESIAALQSLIIYDRPE
jgi:hypothetical protein